MGVGYQDNDLVFCWPDGLSYHPEAFSKTFDRRLRRPRYGGLPAIRLHDLRHTWASLALAAGVDVVIVSKRLGHGSPNTTWQTYQHVMAGMQTDAADKVAALILGSSDRHLKLVSTLRASIPNTSSRSSRPGWSAVTSGPRRTAQPGTPIAPRTLTSRRAGSGCAGLAGACDTL